MHDRLACLTWCDAGGEGPMGQHKEGTGSNCIEKRPVCTSGNTSYMPTDKLVIHPIKYRQNKVAELYFLMEDHF